MRTAGALRIPPSDSEWSRAAHWGAADAKRAVILHGVSYWWSDYYKSREIGVVEIERRADGSWGDPVWIGDLVANEAIFTRFQRWLVDPETAVVANGISHALGRDTDSGFSAWLGRPALVAARNESRLIDLELAYIAGYGIQTGRSRYRETYQGHARWNHTNDEQASMNRAAAWISVSK